LAIIKKDQLFLSNMSEYSYAQRTGAYLLIDSLVQNGVEHIFGYPGGAILPIYDELYHWEKANLIKHILVRQEQSAAHAADAYSRVTNKVGVCFATSGPGATNLVTGIANARMDSIPMVIITGQVGRSFIGTDAFQEIDIFGITLPIVKHSYTVRDTSLLPQILAEAFFLSQNGRPGPVLIDIPKDVGLEETPVFSYPKLNELFSEQISRFNSYTFPLVFKKYLSYLLNSSQPLIYGGGGIIRSNAFNLIHYLAKVFQIPVTTTLMGKSCYNEIDSLSLGMLGMHGTAYANFSVNECDLLLALGARFDDRVTGKLEEFASNAEVIHIDIDPAEISKNRFPQFSIVGDLRKLLLEFFIYLRNESIFDLPSNRSWLKRIDKWKEQYPLNRNSSSIYYLSPQQVIDSIGKSYKNAFFTTDVGQHQMWSAQLINCEPKKWISSAGLGTMGFGLPASIGVKIANPVSDVICISGDSSIQMNIQELSTLSQYELNIKVFILNNGWQGMVRQWQESFYGNRFSNSYMKNGMPDFTRLAQAYNLNGYQIKTLESLESLTPILKQEKVASLIDISILEMENCYPMVAPGRSNAHMLGLEH
jgi:acetolactate synthase I/II/III large subunit